MKNFEKFQHYKDRTPPWIKLYNDLLEDYDFARTPDVIKGHLLLIWLLASRLDNKIPFDSKWVASKINATNEVDLDGMAALGWIVPYSEDESKGKLENWPSRYIPDHVKQEVKDRDNDKCVACNSTENIEFDHKIPVSKGGESTVANLQLLCRSCNRKKRARLSAATETPATQIRSTEGEREAETEKEKEIGANAPLTIWDVGESFGIKRSVMGRMIRDHGEETVSDALRNLSINGKRPADATQYVMGMLRNKVPKIMEGAI